MAKSGGIIVPIVSTFSSKGFTQAESSMKKAGKAFKAFAAIAAAAAIKVGVDGVKAAIQDQAAQEKLATTLKNVTNATQAQIAAIEEQIYQTSLAVGVADDQLRPAYDRLVRSTGDLTKSQQLLDLALNISAGTGKSLDSVVNALGKAYEGSTTSLSRLGTGLDKAALATMSFDEITKSLGETFAGQAASQADTFAGRMERIKVAFSELQEEAGARFLPVLEGLINWILETGLPAFDKFSAWFSENITPAIEKFAAFVEEYVVPAIELLWKWITERLVPAFTEAAGRIKKDIEPRFNRLVELFKEYEPQIKAIAAALAVLVDWIITTGIPWIIERFFEVIALKIDEITWLLDKFLWVLDKVGVGVYEMAQTTTAQLKNMESGFSEMADVQNAKLAASKSGLLGYQKEVKNTAKVGVDSYNAIGDAAAASADKQAKAAAKIQKINDKLEASWIKSMAAARTAAISAAKKAEDAWYNFHKMRTSLSKTQKDMAADLTQNIFDQFTLDEAAQDAGEETGKTFIQAFIDKMRQGKDFAQNVQKLISQGLNLESVKEIIAQGSFAGGAIASELVASPEQIAQINQAQSELKLAAASLANQVTKIELGYDKTIEQLDQQIDDYRFLKNALSNQIVYDAAGQIVTDSQVLEQMWNEQWAQTSQQFKDQYGYLAGGQGTIFGGWNTEGMQPPDYIGAGSQNVQNTYITVNGALDPEAVARQIDGIMRTSASRTGNYTTFGIAPLAVG